VARAKGAWPEGTKARKEVKARARQRGVASFYGSDFHGRTTANGEVFDMRRLTAAHRSLPFGTQVRVIDVSNGRSVVVRINDRGPYHGDRIIDLSRAAAVHLGIIDRGTAEVDLEILDDRLAEVPDELYAVQLGAFAFEEAAEKFIARVEQEWSLPKPVYVKPPCNLSRFYRVRMGPFRDKDKARSVARTLKTGMGTLVVQEDPTMFLEGDGSDQPFVVTQTSVIDVESSSQAR
jgi:rare lipoprotein A